VELALLKNYLRANLVLPKLANREDVVHVTKLPKSHALDVAIQPRMTPVCARNALLAHVKHVTKKLNEVVYVHLVTNYPKVKNCAQQQIVKIIRNKNCVIGVIMKPKVIKFVQCVKPNILNFHRAFANIALERICSIARVVKLHWVPPEHANRVEIFKRSNIRTLQSSVSISRNRKAKKSIVPRLQLLGNFARTVTS
jgi:hypothetical protein